MVGCCAFSFLGGHATLMLGLVRLAELVEEPCGVVVQLGGFIVDTGRVLMGCGTPALMLLILAFCHGPASPSALPRRAAEQVSARPSPKG